MPPDASNGALHSQQIENMRKQNEGISKAELYAKPNIEMEYHAEVAQVRISFLLHIFVMFLVKLCHEKAKNFYCYRKNARKACFKCPPINDTFFSSFSKKYPSI